MLRSIKNTRRLLMIAYILAREDALFLLDDYEILPALSFFVKLFARRKKGKRKGERLATALERLGPAFIKLGQAVSTRSDLIGEEIADDLALLRDRLPPFPTAQAKAIVEAELEYPLHALYQEFSEEPVAAASIAQVHKAVTHGGKTVAVKIVRPNIEKAFGRDIDLFFWIADILHERLPDYRRLKPRQVVETLKRSTFFELDLRFEAAAADEMAKNIKNHETGMQVPGVDWDLTSRKVLTTDWVDGISFSDMPAIRASGFDLDLLLQKASNSMFSQIFQDGFFHADMHPGNVFLDIKTGNLVAVDFGIMGRLDWQSRAYIAQILHGFLTEDYRAVAELHFAAGYVPEDKDLESFVQACKAVARPIIGKPLNEISIAKLLGQMFKIAAEFEMEVQPQLLLMQKTLMVAEGFGRMLNPKLNMWELARPLIEEWATTNFSHKARAMQLLTQTRALSYKLPALLKNVESALKSWGDAEGIRLHRDSIDEINLQRQNMHRQWLIFAWAALAVTIATILLTR